MNNFTFPPLPEIKKYKRRYTEEQEILARMLSKQRITLREEQIMGRAIEANTISLQYLKKIPLSTINVSEAIAIVEYLQSVFRFHFTFQNKVQVYNLYRVSKIQTEFVSEGKVRETRFLSYPPLEKVLQMGVYGRANSPVSTCFYCSTDPYVAVLETKPNIGDRIILSRWLNLSGELNSFPITSKIAGSQIANNASKALIERMKEFHPLVRMITDQYMGFLSSEFVKSDAITSERKFEYLYSSFFADLILNTELELPQHNPEGLDHYDCIIYPSVACNHQYENIAIKPKSVSKLSLYQLSEYTVEHTFYEDKKIEEGKLPFSGKLVRTSDKIRNGIITWNDD